MSTSILTKHYSKLSIALIIIVTFFGAVSIAYVLIFMIDYSFFYTIIPPQYFLIVTLSGIFILFIILFKVFKYTKIELKALLVTSLTAFFLEFIGEPLAWYLGVWDLFVGEKNALVVIHASFINGIVFFVSMLLGGLIYLYFWRKGYKVLIYILFFSSVFIGYFCDIFGGFNTFLLSIYIWFFAHSLYLYVLIKSYQYFQRKAIAVQKDKDYVIYNLR